MTEKQDFSKFKFAEKFERLPSGMKLDHTGSLRLERTKIDMIPEGLELPKFENITEVEFDVLVEEIPYQEIILKVGAIIGDELLPIVLDAQGNTGIYYGYCSDLQRYGIFAKTVNSYVRIAAVAKDDNKDMYVKFNKHAEHYDLSYSDDGITYTPIEHQATQTMNCPKYLGGNGTIYGDGIVFLNECQATTDKTFKFYEKGKYISVNTLQQDLEERIITGEPQECQKIIEIQKENGKKVIDLEMDSMYTTRSFESNAKQLNICDEYAYNKGVTHFFFLQKYNGGVPNSSRGVVIY